MCPAIRPVRLLAVAAASAVAVAGCSSSGKPSKTPSSSNPTAPLSKTQFVTQTDAMCRSFNAKRKALPTPKGPTDFADLTKTVQGTLDLVPAYISQARALVGRSADKAVLTSKWVSVEQADFTTNEPLAKAVLAASKAKDSAAIQQTATKLAAAPNHGAQMATFLKSYGLTDCATLESS